MPEKIKMTSRMEWSEVESKETRTEGRGTRNGNLIKLGLNLRIKPRSKRRAETPRGHIAAEWIPRTLYARSTGGE
jgi:hypothetical protein